MPQDAWNELEDIEAKERARPEVLKVRVEVCRALKQWECSWLHTRRKARESVCAARTEAIRRSRSE